MSDKDGSQSGAIESKVTEAIKPILDSLPADPQNRLSGLTKIHQCLSSIMIGEAEASVNVLFASAPDQTLVEKKEIAQAITDHLDSLGLAIRCQKTGRPGRLICDVKGSYHPPQSRFRLEVIDGLGRRARTFVSRHAFKLELMQKSAAIIPLGIGGREEDGISR